MLTSLRRLSLPMAVLVAVIALLVLGDVAIVTYRLTSTAQRVSNAPTQQAPSGKQHPCNHGFYVSQAAHSKKGGASVSGVAQSKLGKDKSCSAPAPAPASSSSESDSDD